MLKLNDASFYTKFPAFNLAKDVAEICKPLFESIDACYFDYNRIYEDNTFFSLSSNRNWLEHFFKMKYKLCTAFKTSEMHLWDSYYYTKAVHDARINFNLANGITIIFKRNNYIEYVDIAAPVANRAITSVYLNQTDLLHHFIDYFVEKADKLISIAEDKKVILPEMITKKSTISDNDTYFLINETKLSPREFECLNHYLNGKTAKETAHLLNLSARTIEEYIENIKKKLKCRYKRDLMKFRNLG